VQVIACIMKTAPSAADTRQRLLDAAARIFARDGLTGATTRAIAEEAGVNEVTLFRHFQTKDRLLAAVVGENFGTKGMPASSAESASTGNLRVDLFELVGRYDALLAANWPLVRAMLGEMHHHLSESHERQVFRAVFQPVKEAVGRRIAAAQEAGEIASDQRPDVLSDLLLGMVFTGVLRRNIPHLKIEYSAPSYLTAAVDMFLEGAVAR
jgi:AcrR family transcriptional regulator